MLKNNDEQNIEMMNETGQNMLISSSHYRLEHFPALFHHLCHTKILKLASLSHIIYIL